jgi:cell division protease FtsH
MSQIASLFGGRIAEELIFGRDNITTGASNDIERATQLARNMVTRWGLSDKMGPLVYGSEEGEVFLGRQTTKPNDVSDATTNTIDAEIRQLIDKNYALAKSILEEKISILHKMAAALMKYETIDEHQLAQLMKGDDCDPPKGWDEKPSQGKPNQSSQAEATKKSDAAKDSLASTGSA